MICAKCGTFYEQIVCPKCTERAGREALRIYQLNPLRQIARGRAKLLTRDMNGTRHIQMFGADRTYCYLPIEAHHRRGTIALDALNAAAARWAAIYPGMVRGVPGREERFCSKCHEEVKRLVAEACTCSA